MPKIPTNDSIFLPMMESGTTTIYILNYSIELSKAKEVKMEKKNRISAILAIFILAFASPIASDVYPEFVKWHVYIVNGLRNNQNLLAHCKSADDDLGVRNLSQGSNFTWSFRTDFAHSTLFWCHVKKDNNNACESATFDVFWYDERLFQKCDWKKCIWSARDDGIYLTNIHQNVDDLYYYWDAGE